MSHGSRTWMEVLQLSQWFDPVSTHQSAAVSAGTALTPPAGANKLLVQALTQNVRYVVVGGTAAVGTATGFQLKAADPPRVIQLGTDAALAVIAETGTAALQYQWGK